MSISEQVKELRDKADIYNAVGSAWELNRAEAKKLQTMIRKAADTIESLYAKLADMERSAEDCGSGWIECESGKLPDKEVICCDVCGEIIIGYIHETYESEQTGFSAENSHEYMYNCVKWMEKPKP